MSILFLHTDSIIVQKLTTCNIKYFTFWKLPAQHGLTAVGVVNVLQNVSEAEFQQS